MIRQRGNWRPADQERADEGVSLILALMFVTGIGIVVGALLTYSATGITSARATLAADQSEYDAGGALQTAINAVRTSSYNDPNSPCLTSGYVNIPDSSGAVVRVACRGGPGTGSSAGDVPITSANRPGSAILTLGAEAGIQLGSNGTLAVKGQIRDNSGISHGGAKSAIGLVGPSTLEAKGPCATVTIDPAASASCNWTPTTTADQNSFADPITLDAAAYSPPPTDVAALTYQTVPACPAGAKLITLLPGYYDDAAALNGLTDKSCSGAVLWFRPGQYYFDFHNREGKGVVPNGADLWTIDDSSVKIVAGTPQGWTTSPLTSPSIPGACVSPLSSMASGKGVQFAFGGDSHVEIVAGQLEVCGQYSATHPSLAVYGIPDGADPSATATLVADGTGTTPTGTSDAPFPQPGLLPQKDGIATTASIDSTTASKATAGVTTKGFGTDAVPTGSFPTSVTVALTHWETLTGGALNGITLRVSGTVDVGGVKTPIPLTSLPPSNSPTTNATVSVPVDTSTARLIHAGTPVTSTVTVEAVAAATGKGQNRTQTKATVNLDAVQLKLAYAPPAVRGETTAIAGSNCVGALNYSINDTGTCALIRTSGAQTRLYVQGTTYSPKAALDIQLTNVSSQVFRSGIIVRTLVITVTASSRYTGPVIEVPDDSVGLATTPLDVYFSAYVCTSGANCSGISPPDPPWRLAGQALATFTDPTLGSRGVTIKTWNLPR